MHSLYTHNIEEQEKVDAGQPTSILVCFCTALRTKNLLFSLTKLISRTQVDDKRMYTIAAFP